LESAKCFGLKGMCKIRLDCLPLEIGLDLPNCGVKTHLVSGFSHRKRDERQVTFNPMARSNGNGTLGVYLYLVQSRLFTVSEHTPPQLRGRGDDLREWVVVERPTVARSCVSYHHFTRNRPWVPFCSCHGISRTKEYAYGLFS